MEMSIAVALTYLISERRMYASDALSTHFRVFRANTT
jgi:hypothetical protein